MTTTHLIHYPWPTPNSHVLLSFGSLTVTQGYFFMGVMILGVTLTILMVYFPQWGGMLVGAKPGVSEEDYYLAGERSLLPLKNCNPSPLHLTLLGALPICPLKPVVNHDGPTTVTPECCVFAVSQ